MATAAEIREQHLQVGNILADVMQVRDNACMGISLNIVETREKAVKVTPANGTGETFWLPKKAFIFKKVKGTSERKGNLSYDIFLAQWLFFDEYQFRIIEKYAEWYVA